MLWLNAQSCVVTTSSCSGRIAVFLGSSDPSGSKGGKWLLTSHEVVLDTADAWNRVLGGLLQSHDAEGISDKTGTLATLLLEPFILHAECADTDTAQRMLEAAREVGLRESGLSLGRRRVMVQLRTTALRLEVPLALDGCPLVDAKYFGTLLGIANERLKENARRVDRLWVRLREVFSPTVLTLTPEVARPPWVLVCSQSSARVVKLATEQRGFMDETRKMAPLDLDGEAGKGPPQVGIPVNEIAARTLEALRCQYDAELETQPAENAIEENDGLGSISKAAANCTIKTGAVDIALNGETSDGKIARACGKNKDSKVAKYDASSSEPADLELMWRGSVLRGDGRLRLIKSDALPRKERAPQRGNAVRAAMAERDAITQVVAEVHAQVASGTPLAELQTELRALGPLQWRGDVALLPRDGIGVGLEQLSRAAVARGGLWEPLRVAVGARLLARQQEIRVESGVRAGAVEVLAGSGDGWVVVPGPRGVRYTFDVTRCMFSEGNAAEKDRVAEWQVTGETILDLYAGIGFWTLPLLAGGAERVYACEWNPDAVEGLRRGLALLGEAMAARCDILEGDNRRDEVRKLVAGRCDRVLLGLIPFSRDGFPVAVAAVRDSGGLLHVHWNAPCDEEEAIAGVVAKELETAFRDGRGQEWHCSVVGIQRVKWFAPRVRHLRIDVRCEPDVVTDCQ